MVGKLMKYEFLRTRYPLALAAGIGLAICALAYLLALLAPVVAMVPFVVGFVMGLIFTFAVQIYLAVDFYRSSFGRRGYFTHSLPVTGTMLVLTKLGHAARHARRDDLERRAPADHPLRARSNWA